jgi:hypothetical protein
LAGPDEHRSGWLNESVGLAFRALRTGTGPAFGTSTSASTARATGSTFRAAEAFATTFSALTTFTTATAELLAQALGSSIGFFIGHLAVFVGVQLLEALHVASRVLVLGDASIFVGVHTQEEVTHAHATAAAATSTGFTGGTLTLARTTLGAAFRATLLRTAEAFGAVTRSGRSAFRGTTSLRAGAIALWATGTASLTFAFFTQATSGLLGLFFLHGAIAVGVHLAEAVFGFLYGVGGELFFGNLAVAVEVHLLPGLFQAGAGIATGASWTPRTSWAAGPTRGAALAFTSGRRRRGILCLRHREAEAERAAHSCDRTEKNLFCQGHRLRWFDLDPVCRG